MHCPNCGAEASAKQKFCRACGLSLDRFAQLLAETPANTEDKNITQAKRRLRQLESGIKLAGYGVMLGIFSFVAILFALSGVNEMIDGNIGAGIALLGIAVGIIAAEGFLIYSASLHAKVSAPQPSRPRAPFAETTNKLLPEQQAQIAMSVTEQTTARLNEEIEPRS
jgi:zinc ribbon protein